MASLGSGGSLAVGTWQAKTRGFEPRSRQNIIGEERMKKGLLDRCVPVDFG
jgi:hypothetical protein